MLLLGTLAALFLTQEASTRDLFFQGLQDRDIKVTRLKSDATKRAANFGVRYNLLLVTDPAKGISHEVDPDHNFSKGDCVLMRFMPNRGGFLYVFNQGSSGKWSTLLPSPEMKGEPPGVAAGVETTVPLNYCLRVEDPPGVEKLMVVVTDSESEALQLNKAMRSVAALEPVLEKLSASAAEIRNMASRDLSAVRMSGPVTEQGAPPKSVYIVKTAMAASDTLSLNIRIRHE